MLHHSAEPTLGLTSTLLTEQERKLLLELIPRWQEFGKNYAQAIRTNSDLNSFVSVRNKVAKILKPPSFGIRFDELEEVITNWKQAPSFPEKEKSWDSLQETCQKGINLKKSRSQPADGESFLLDEALKFKETSLEAATVILKVLADALSPTSPVPCPLYHQEEKNRITVKFPRFSSNEIPVYGFLAKPEGSGPFPIVIIGHDGLWGLTPFSITASLLLARQGFLAFAPEYRGQGLSHGIFERAGGEVDDTVNAISYLAENEGGDPSKVGLIGDGLGGAVSFIAATRTNVQGVILLPTVLDLLAFWNALQKSKDRAHTWRIVSLLLLCGGAPDQLADAYRKRSPIQYLDRFKSNLLLLLGDSDSLLPVTKIADSIREFKSFETRYKLILYGKGDHSLHLGPQGQDIWENVLHFLYSMA